MPRSNAIPDAHPLPADIVPETLAAVGQTTQHIFSPLDFLDPGTSLPLGCSCGGCQHIRDSHQRMFDEDLARTAFDRAAEIRRRAHQAETPNEVCRSCGYGGLPHCGHCGKCTARGASAENRARRRSEYPSLQLQDLRDRPSTILTHARVHSCCICLVCDRCNDALAASARCRAGHHIGCNCDCVTCPQCGVVRGREGDAYHTPMPLDANGRPVRCDTCSGVRGCCCGCQACQSCGAAQETRTRGSIGDLVENRCQNCGLCITCCRCVPLASAPPPDDAGERPAFQRGLFRKWDPSPSWGLLSAGLAADGQANPYKRYIGLEIECASGGTRWLNHVVVRTWGGNIVQDGSLPPRTGFEINTAPAAGDMYVKQVHEICEEFARTRVQANNQCGLHVHVDCSDFNIWDMRRLVNLYRRIEAGMFQLLPKSRQGNHFCEPCGDQWWKVFNDPHKTRELKGRLSSALYGVDVSQLEDRMDGDKKKIQAQMMAIKRAQSGKGNALRYRALNVHSWFLRGTLEFRMGAVVWVPGTVPLERDIRNWGLVCCSVVEAARRMSDAEVSKVAKSYTSLYGLAPTPDVKRWMTETLKRLASRPAQAAGTLSFSDRCPCDDGCVAGDCGDCCDNDRNFFSAEQLVLREGN
jgi:hypothetical protein